MANVYESVLSSGGPTPAIITPSNANPAAMVSDGIYQAAAAGYAIASYDSKTPSDSTPPAVANGDIVKMGGAGYLYETQQGPQPIGGDITSVSVNTEYTIDTGLPNLKYFCAFQFYPATTDMMVLIWDYNNPTYQIRCFRRAGASQGCNQASLSAGSSTYVGDIISVGNDGKVKIKTGTASAGANAKDIHWMAY